MVPHVTDAIQDWILQVAAQPTTKYISKGFLQDVLLCVGPLVLLISASSSWVVLLEISRVRYI